MGAYYGLGLGLGGAPVPIRGSHLAVGGLIEQFPGAAAAYSLRALRNNTGNVVRVRRSLDDAEQDFTAAQVSDGTLTTFCGAGDGFVTKWYGQVPGVNFSNSTSTSQPKIVNNGSLITGNSVGMPLWDGSNDTLRVLASEMPTPTTAFQISVVCKNNKSALSGNEYIFGQYESWTNNRSFALIYRPTSRIGVNFGNPSTGAFGGSWSSDGVTLIGELLAVGVTYNAGTVKIYVNGSEVSSSILTGSIPTSLFNTSSDYTIGSALSSDSPVAVFDGQIGEIYFAKNLTDDIVKIQQNQMEGWGITP